MKIILPIPETEYQRRLQNAKKRRLQELELQAAIYGFGVRPEVLVEIDNIQKDLSTRGNERGARKKRSKSTIIDCTFCLIIKRVF